MTSTSKRRHSKSNAAQSLHENVEKLVEKISLDCFPEKDTVPKLGVNDLKRWAMILNAAGKKKLWGMLSSQQRLSTPSGLFV